MKPFFFLSLVLSILALPLSIYLQAVNVMANNIEAGLIYLLVTFVAIINGVFAYDQLKK